MQGDARRLLLEPYRTQFRGCRRCSSLIKRSRRATIARLADGPCRTAPQLTEHEPGHYVSCHFAGELELSGAMDHPSVRVANR